MAEARMDSEWNHTSALLALLANAHRDPKKRGPFKQSDFHPLRKRESRGERITADNIGILKALLPPGGKRKRKRT